MNVIPRSEHPRPDFVRPDWCTLNGAWGYHEKVHDKEEFFRRYQSVTDAARSIPYCQGYCYTQLTDVQQEINGLLTPDRKPKIDPERFAALTKNPDGRYC